MTTNSNLSFIFSVCITCIQTDIHIYILVQYICKHTSTPELYHAMFQHIRKYDTVFILSSFSFSTVHMNNVSLTLHFTVRNILGLCSILHINFSYSFFNYNLIYITCLCTFTLHFPLFVPLPIMCCFIPHFLSHCHFWSVYQSLYVHHFFILFFAHTFVFQSSPGNFPYSSLPSVCEAGTTYFFTVTNIPSFCSVVHLSSFSVHASFELPTAVLPESQLFWEVNIA